MNIGGKPNFALPAFIPIIFELTVLFSAVGMFFTFCYLCQLAPFIKKHHFHPRATDDYFVMAIECTDRTNVEDLKGFMQNAGAIEVNYQVAESDWWFGRYDKQQKLYVEPSVI